MPHLNMAGRRRDMDRGHLGQQGKLRQGRRACTMLLSPDHFHRHRSLRSCLALQTTTQRICSTTIRFLSTPYLRHCGKVVPLLLRLLLVPQLVIRCPRQSCLVSMRCRRPQSEDVSPNPIILRTLLLRSPGTSKGISPSFRPRRANRFR